MELEVSISLNEVPFINENLFKKKTHYTIELDTLCHEGLQKHCAPEKESKVKWKFSESRNRKQSTVYGSRSQVNCFTKNV